MNKGNTHTEITELQGTVKLYHSYPSRPSWKSYGEGRAVVEISGNPKWPTIDIHGTEIPEGNKGTKEVYLSVPVGQVIALLEKIGYVITPPALPCEAEKSKH